MFVIAKQLKTSEAEIYRYLNGEKIPPEVEARLKRLWLDLVGVKIERTLKVYAIKSLSVKPNYIYMLG